MEKLKPTKTKIIQQSATRQLRDRLTAAAAAYFPDFPLVGTKQAFCVYKGGGKSEESIRTVKENEFDYIEEKKWPLLLVEVIDDGGYVALKLDFFNC